MSEWECIVTVSRSELHDKTWFPCDREDYASDYSLFRNCGPLGMVKRYVERNFAERTNGGRETHWRRHDQDTWDFEVRELP